MALPAIAQAAPNLQPGSVPPILAFTAVGERGGQEYGYSVNRAGDINGDGYGDVIVGAWGFDAPGMADAGKIYVYHGSANGLSPTPAYTAVGQMADAYFGFAVAPAGDVNGDSYGDVVVGSYRYDDTPVRGNAGKVYVFHGGPNGLTGTPAAPAFSAVGETANDWFSGSVAGAGDVNGDGYSDIIVAAESYAGGAGGRLPRQGVRVPRRAEWVDGHGGESGVQHGG